MLVSFTWRNFIVYSIPELIVKLDIFCNRFVAIKFSKYKADYSENEKLDRVSKTFEVAVIFELPIDIKLSITDVKMSYASGLFPEFLLYPTNPCAWEAQKRCLHKVQLMWKENFVVMYDTLSLKSHFTITSKLEKNFFGSSLAGWQQN